MRLRQITVESVTPVPLLVVWPISGRNSTIGFYTVIRANSIIRLKSMSDWASRCSLQRAFIKILPSREERSVSNVLSKSVGREILFTSHSRRFFTTRADRVDLPSRSLSLTISSLLCCAIVTSFHFACEPRYYRCLAWFLSRNRYQAAHRVKRPNFASTKITISLARFTRGTPEKCK